MNRNRRRTTTSLLLLLVVVATGLSMTPAQDAIDRSATPVPEHMPTNRAIGKCIIPADLNDEAYAQHVDLLLLGTAWDHQDPALLTDIALQLVEGERILLRAHKVLKADQVFEVAAHLAGDRKDHSTLKRLAKAAERRGDKQLAALLVHKTAEAEVVDGHPIAHAIEDMTPAALEAHQAAIRRIRAARLAGSREGLDKLDKYFDSHTYLHKAQQDHIDKEIAKARAAMPKEPTLHDLIVTLDRLAAITPCSQ